ncbi:LysR substrate-binding domain-containing protein [Bradyrhizobium sp.]|uniref:LysR substrate-binding domain-containing protein n=1 Tax=Bradyrhizobium sp. TaxID=376 RepID=UPI003C6EA795
MSEAVEEFRARALSGHVRLGLSEDFASAGLTATVVGFLSRNPEVDLTTEIGMSGDLFRRLDEGRLDLVFAKRRCHAARAASRAECDACKGAPGSGLGCECLRALRHAGRFDAYHWPAAKTRHFGIRARYAEGDLQVCGDGSKPSWPSRHVEL